MSDRGWTLVIGFLLGLAFWSATAWLIMLVRG